MRGRTDSAKIDLEARVEFLARSILGRSHTEYRRVNRNRSLFGLRSNVHNRTYSPLFGDPPPTFIAAVNNRFVESRAGYRVDVGKAFPHEPAINADVLIIAADLLEGPESHLDAIVLHELCHWAIDASVLGPDGLVPDQVDQLHGDAIYQRLDWTQEAATKHTRSFCALLAAATQRLAERHIGFQDRYEAMNSAMRYDLLEPIPAP